MTGDGKILKLSCLAALFVGLASVVLGVFIAVGNVADIDAWITAADGLLSTVFGVRCAILANVPSNTSKIRGKAAIFLLGALAIVAGLLFAGFEVEVPQIAIAAVICVIALVALLLAGRIVKEQLRK